MKELNRKTVVREPNRRVKVMRRYLFGKTSSYRRPSELVPYMLTLAIFLNTSPTKYTYV